MLARLGSKPDPTGTGSTEAAMTRLIHDLPGGVTEWVEGVGSGEITRLERHVARREAWVVDVTRRDGSVLEGFLRVDRNPVRRSNISLEKEARIVEALGPTSIPVAKLHGWNETLQAALFERDPGRSDLDKLEDSVQQRAIMEDFIRIVARLHALEIDALGLDDVMPDKPTTPEECALGDLDHQLAQFATFLEGYTDPLITYGVDWLRRHAPKSVARVSLVQGDTGPVNFMFQGDRVSSVIDWEWGHLGDPMEDLGNICVREFWNPSGGLKGLFELYAQESGIPYTRFAAQYYRVQQNVRGMIPIHAVCANAHPRESVAWYLCYRYVGDRSTCEALAEAMEVAIERPEMPEAEGEPDALAEAAVYAQENDVQPGLEQAFGRSRAKDVTTLIRCMDRKRRYGPALAAIEIEEVGALLGAKQASMEHAFRALEHAIAESRLDDEPLIRYLARKAYRDEWLFAPAVALYPDRRWSELD
jgi:aminoglycoside phosphotransferase (APT) family kinase protein